MNFSGIFYASWCMIVGCSFLSLVSCGSGDLRCGGVVYPSDVSTDALKIVEKSKVNSREFCSHSDYGCNFTVAKIDGGWSVAVVRVLVVRGRCASRIGDDIFFIYNDSGVLVKTLNGV